jgi:hypothetical protein
VERFNLRNLSKLEVTKEYQIKNSKRFAPLENKNDTEDINRVLENIKKNIKTSAKGSLGLCEMKQHKPWFDEECLRFLNKKKHAKMQRLQVPDQNNRNNENNVRREANRQVRNKKLEYLKAKIVPLKRWNNLNIL